MLQYIDKLILFEAVRTDKVARLLAALLHDTPGRDLASATIETRYEVERELVKYIGSEGISGNCLQNHLCRVMASEENAFAHMAEAGVFKGLECGAGRAKTLASLTPEAASILKLAASEIQKLSCIYHFDFAEITDTADGPCIASASAANAANDPNGISHRELIHKAMMQGDSEDAAILLARFYHGYGSGIFEAAPALIAEDGGLVPVLHTDPTTMDDLVGCDRQKRMLIDNTEILLSGLKANNVLLYGDSGTGKSSSVKALLNMYRSRGLKLISVAKDRLGLLPGVFERIAGRGMKFIIFIDDLSFEENEHEYKLFKSIVEGRIAPSPKNAIFIVTTNRKNLVKEAWHEREGGDDVRIRDNMEEKRSLSDRFGITLVYPAPDKKEYLEIVRSIADKAGLSMPEKELSTEALKWEIRHGGRSGRTARQFVDYMAGIEKIGSGGFAE